MLTEVLYELYWPDLIHVSPVTNWYQLLGVLQSYGFWLHCIFNHVGFDYPAFSIIWVLTTRSFLDRMCFDHMGFDFWRTLSGFIFQLYGFWLPCFFNHMGFDYPVFSNILWVLTTRSFLDSMCFDHMGFDIHSRGFIFPLYILLSPSGWNLTSRKVVIYTCLCGSCNIRLPLWIWLPEKLLYTGTYVELNFQISCYILWAHAVIRQMQKLKQKEAKVFSICENKWQ